ncbi:MAG: hypothetical protein OYK82_14835 [Gammaproteobacteria bacterium]|nr:hypothetical protein [Gammaproteobacteria bacterium]
MRAGANRLRGGGGGMCPGSRRPSASAGVIAAVAAVLLLGGCELTEVTLAESDDVVVAETRLILDLDTAEGAPSLNVYAYLHRTLSAARADEVEGARVRVSGASGAVVQLEPEESGDDCLSQDPENPNEDVGSCYRAFASPSPFLPRDVVELEVVLADGSTLTASSRIPGAFDFIGLTYEDGHCRLEPDTNYRFGWTEAEGTWSYLSDTWIMGLPEALAGEDVAAPDSLYLTGFGIGQEDTDVLFPGEYGLFDVADDVNVDLLRVLDDGLPGGAWARLAFAATDRNWVNWVRGGNFNPSGMIRIPSVFGDGTGVFGTATQRELHVRAGPGGDGMPPLCGPPAPDDP